MMSPTKKPGEKLVAGPDASWRGLYRAGGITAILYVVLGVIVPAGLVLTAHYDFKMTGAALLEFISLNKTWWIILQTLVLGTSILAIVSFAAIFTALKHLNKSCAAIGVLVAGVCQLLFMAYYPVLLGLAYLSDQYMAATDTQQAAIIAASEALIAQNNAFNPLYESVFAAGILLISLVMLKGVFPRTVAYLGIAIAPAAILALILWPIVGVSYFWWWALFVIWLVAAGWRLLRLGSGKFKEAGIPMETGR